MERPTFRGTLAVALVVTASGATQAPRPHRSVVAGRVEPAGPAAAGAAVVARWLAHPELPGSLALAAGDAHCELRSAAGADGSFRLELPDRGPFAIWAETDAGLRSPLRFPVLAGDYLRLELVACPVLSGSVLDLRGQPVAGARVVSAAYGDVTDYGQRYRFPLLERSVQTDAAGRFAYPQWPPPAPFISPERSLRASHGRFASSARFYLQAGQTNAEVNLRLQEMATVAADRPVGADDVVAPDKMPVLFADGSRGTCALDAEGRRRLDRPPGSRPDSGYVLCDGRYLPFAASVDAATGAAIVQLLRTHDLHGVVLDVDRQPIASARVLLYSAGLPARGYCVTYTDRGGRFAFEAVPHGAVELGVAAGSEGVCFVSAPAGPYPEPLRVTMRGLTVEGRVTLPTGSLAADAEVQYCVQHERFDSVYVFFRSGADGTFRVRGLPAGTAFTSYAFCVREGTGYMSQMTGQFAEGLTLAHRLQPYRGQF